MRLIIGLLLLTGAILAAAPATQADPTARIWDGEAGWEDMNWSNPVNWVGDILPSNGDDLVFPEGSYAGNDEFLTSVGSVELGRGASVTGSAVSLTGPMLAHMDDDIGACWDVPTTLTGDTAITLTPITNPTGAPFTIGQEFSLQGDSGASHTLTVDAQGESRADHGGGITGGDDWSLIKQGTGKLSLGMPWEWTERNTWTGPTDVQAGVLSITSPGALSSHTDVHVASGACVKAEMWGWDVLLEDVWSNEFTGDGGIEVDYGHVTFTGASSSFAGTLTICGTATIASGAELGGTADVTSMGRWGGSGTLYGLGTVEALTVDPSGTLNPGLGDFGVGTLTASGEVSWNGGGTYAVDVSDADGPAGSGYDSLVIGGDEPGLTVSGSAAEPFTFFLVSSDGYGAGPCEGFDNRQSYRWGVATLASGGISGWDAAEDVTVDSTQFATYNDLGGGAFAAEPSADGSAVDVVFTPSPPDTLVWDGGGGDDKWSTAANWVGDTVPTDGDSLVFPDGTVFDPVNDLEDLTLQDVTLARPGMAVLGNAIVLTGALVRTVADEAEIDWHPDLRLGEEATLGSTAGIVNIKGAVSGGDLTKTGAGTVSLRHACSYTGKTVVEGGTLHFNADGALPDGSAVSIAAGARVNVDPTDKSLKVYDNVFSGPEGATLRFSYGLTELTADSSGFAGTTELDISIIVTGSLGGTISGKGVVAGPGTVGAMDGTIVFPGVRGEESFAISTLTGSYWTGEAAGFGITDAAGDPGVGHDQLRITGDVDIPPLIDGKGGLMVLPASVDGTGAIGLCENFDPASSYRWPVVHVDGEVNGFDPAATQVVVLATMFTNDLGGGAFSLELTDHVTYRTLDLVFTPAGPDTHVWDGGGGDDKWSTAGNWVGDTAPVDGDAVRFAGSIRKTNTNDLLTSVSGVEFANGGWVITGDALATTGDIVSEATSGTTWIQQAVTLTDDVAITSATDGKLSLLQLHLHDGVAGHGLTLGGTGTVNVAAIDGAGTDCTLTKTGQGAAHLVGPNTFGGAVTISEGTLRLLDTQAIPAGVPVGIADSAMLWVQSTSGDKTFTLDNVISGTSRAILTVWKDTLRLTGDSSGYAGSEQPCVGGNLRVDGKIGGSIQPNAGLITGIGTIGRMVLSNNGILSPGRADYEIGGLKATGDVELMGDSTYRFDVADADGDPGQGYDNLRVAGPTGGIVASTSDWPCAVVVRSSDESGPADAASFDPAKAYRWHLVTATTGSITHFAADKFALGTSGFTNDLEGGSFSLDTSADGKSLDLVFTPVADFTEDPLVGNGGDSFAKGSEQTVAWEMDAAPPAGSVFKVVADDPGSTTSILLATVPATSETEYSYDWTIGEGPSTGWHVTVQLWTKDGAGGEQLRSADSQDFDILAASYTITVTAGANGEITPGTGSVTTYDDKTYTITPATGYHVADVEVDDVSQGAVTSYEFEDVRADHTISATFAVDRFDITPSVMGGAGGHGTISPSTRQTVDYGATPTFTFAPAEGYHVKEVKVDDTAVTMTGTNEYTFAAVDDDHTISVEFAIDTFAITPSVVGGSAGHGTISPSEPATVDWHGAPTFTFAPERGYEVDVILVDGQPVAMTGEDEYTFPAVTAAHTISVSFKVRTFTITVGSCEYGSITPGTCSVEWGATPEYAITPQEGCSLVDVLVDGASVGAVTSYRFASVEADHTLEATFVSAGMPWASVSGASARWSRRPVTLTFTGHPGDGGVPVAYTEYKVGSGEWARGSAVKIRAQGVTRVWYRAVDEAGTVQDPPGSCRVRVDTRRPRVIARALTATGGGSASLRYEVADPRPSSGTALVRAVVVDGANRALTRASTLPVSTNAWHQLRISTASLRPGTYTLVLRAKDRAGNFQRGVTHVRLTIRWESIRR